MLRVLVIGTTILPLLATVSVLDGAGVRGPAHPASGPTAAAPHMPRIVPSTTRATCAPAPAAGTTTAAQRAARAGVKVGKDRLARTGCGKALAASAGPPLDNATMLPVTAASAVLPLGDAMWATMTGDARVNPSPVPGQTEYVPQRQRGTDAVFLAFVGGAVALLEAQGSSPATSPPGTTATGAAAAFSTWETPRTAGSAASFRTMALPAGPGGLDNPTTAGGFSGAASSADSRGTTTSLRAFLAATNGSMHSPVWSDFLEPPGIATAEDARSSDAKGLESSPVEAGVRGEGEALGQSHDAGMPRGPEMAKEGEAGHLVAGSSTVPEPVTLSLVGGGLAMLGLVRRRTRGGRQHG